MKLPDHPCISEEAHSRVARIHLPVAPRCNTDCGYCDRRRSTLEERPGACETVLSPGEGIAEALEFLKTWGDDSVVGIAGPGEPLANESTFETIRLLKEKKPDVRLCLCTNGVNLPEAVPALVLFGFEHVSVTVNSVNTETIEKIHPFIRYNGRSISGKEGAALLLEQQIKGIRALVQAGVFVKVNSVAIPGINLDDLPETAEYMARIGVGIMNIMPLIPGGRFNHLMPPDMSTMERLYRECGRYLPVFKKCRQCRADAKGIPGKESCRWRKTA